MRRIVVLSAMVTAMLLVLCGTGVSLTDTATQTVTITVEEIAVLAASGDPATLTLVPPAGGSLPTPVTNALTSLDWTSNVASGNTRTITAQLDADFSGTIVLKATLAAPGGTNGATNNQRTLSSGSAELMFTGITNENCTGATITYEASLSAMMAPVTDESHTVTWTLTEDA